MISLLVKPLEHSKYRGGKSSKATYHRLFVIIFQYNTVIQLLLRLPATNSNSISTTHPLPALEPPLPMRNLRTSILPRSKLLPR